MQFKRQVIRAWDAMNLKNLNDNFSYLWLKVFKNIETGDIEDGAVTADKIKAGAITANKIKTDELEVGKNIKMGANATIDWNTQLVNKPEDLIKSADLVNYVNKTYFGDTLKNYPTNTQVTNALANYLTSRQLSQTLVDYVNNSALTTKLGQDYVITGKILANQITSGVITGCTLQTANGSDYISLQNQYLNIYKNGYEQIKLGFDNGYNPDAQPFLKLNDVKFVGNGGAVNIVGGTLLINGDFVATETWVRNNVSSSSGGVSYVAPYNFGSSGNLAGITGSGGSIYFEKASDGRFIFHVDSTHYVAISPSVCQWSSY